MTKRTKSQAHEEGIRAPRDGCNDSSSRKKARPDIVEPGANADFTVESDDESSIGSLSMDDSMLCYEATLLHWMMKLQKAEMAANALLQLVIHEAEAVFGVQYNLLPLGFVDRVARRFLFLHDNHGLVKARVTSQIMRYGLSTPNQIKDVLDSFIDSFDRIRGSVNIVADRELQYDLEE